MDIILTKTPSGFTASNNLIKASGKTKEIAVYNLISSHPHFFGIRVVFSEEKRTQEYLIQSKKVMLTGFDVELPSGDPSQIFLTDLKLPPKIKAFIKKLFKSENVEVMTIVDLAQYSEKQIKNMKGVGKITIDSLLELLHHYNLSFKKE